MTIRPLRADAARNRERLLEVAYQTFAAEGLAVPVDEIARRAGVGPGTVYRHFPTKEALFEAVMGERVRALVDRARAMLAADPGQALFSFILELTRNSATDQGLADALTRHGIDFDVAVPGAEAAFHDVMTALLSAAQGAGTIRPDVGFPELKALLTICKTASDGGVGVSERVAEVIVDGLRRRS